MIFWWYWHPSFFELQLLKSTRDLYVRKELKPSQAAEAILYIYNYMVVSVLLGPGIFQCFACFILVCWLLCLLPALGRPLVRGWVLGWAVGIGLWGVILLTHIRLWLAGCCSFLRLPAPSPSFAFRL